MLPENLTPASFVRYPPHAKKIAIAHLALFQRLPLSFLPSLLRELIDYDLKFPAERASINRQLEYLSALTPQQLTESFQAFAAIRLTAEQTSIDWCSRPFYFTEQLSAYLWQTHQMMSFRGAATAYGERLQTAVAPPPLPIPRLGIAVIGQGASPPAAVQLFRKLREHGTSFHNIDPEGGVQALLAEVETRAKRCPLPYGHWYVDGGEPLQHSDQVTGVSYAHLAPVRAALLKNISNEVSKPGMGPEELRDHLAQVAPGDLGLHEDPVLDHYKIKVLTEGSGTQIFSTTFVQWSTREALRRAEPVTLMARFAPRQRQRPMYELLAAEKGAPEVDPQGSLIDADMASYYHWIDQQRLSGSQQSTFLAWFEDQQLAVAIGPSLPRNTESGSRLNLKTLLALATS